LIRQPTLVIGGDDDPIVPLANARLLARLIPRGELHVFAGGHIDPLLAPADIGPRITRFLAQSARP
jgi:pimeloyl-ACP methyl ester carboxylesterase